ncbi:hypothetical protein ACXR0O_03790 [Verrucomicrobiota bacterium sgz303538]
MAKILLVISIVITLLTAGLGFMTKTKVDSLQSTLSQTKTDLSSTKSQLDNTKKDLTKTKDDLTAANKQIDDTKQKLTAAETERDEAKKKADDLNGQIAAREKTIAELEDKLKGTSPDKPGVPGLTAEQAAELQEQLKRAVAERDELKAVQDTLNQRVQEADQRAQVAQSTIKRYELGVARQGLTGRVLAVNQGWNFVVLDVGDRQGAAVNAPLLVLRGGQPIARLKVTSVEPSTSIADVIPGSIARGATVQPGDSVVFAGNRNQTPQPVGAAPQPQAPAAPQQPSAPAPEAAVPAQQ